MRKINNINYNVKYPAKEKATAFIPENERPFAYAIIGVTYPLSYYYIERPQESRINSIEYIVDGEGEIFFDGEWKKASAGDVFILRERENHRYRASPTDPWHKIWINYVSDYISLFFDAYGICSGIYHVPDIHRHFDRVLELSRNADVSTDTYYETAECVHSIIAAVTMQTGREAQSDENRIREALNASIYKKADLSELAAALHISKSNLIRVFKKHYGITPYEYLLNAKIETAKLLLVSTSMSIKQIADKLCISDEHYFSSLFLRRVGIRPREYRREHK